MIILTPFSINFVVSMSTHGHWMHRRSAVDFKQTGLLFRHQMRKIQFIFDLGLSDKKVIMVFSVVLYPLFSIHKSFEAIEWELPALPAHQDSL